MPDTPGKRRPENLAANPAAARAGRQMQGERRLVTILFCDVAGSTRMAEQLDPEEWAEIMNEAFQYMIAPVQRYEGTVARLLGDAILVFFGAPVAHEDDPQRAVLAGLDILSGIQQFRKEIQQDYGLDFNLRIGINTGEVVVGEIGSELTTEYTAVGDAVNLAARMEQTAQPGSIQVSEATYRLVAPLFEFKPLGAIKVKGKHEPVQTYQVTGYSTVPGRVRGIPGFVAPLTGRQQEIGTLHSILSDLLRGRGRIVTLVGEAGLGKTRLIDEACHAWSTMGNPPNTWIESRGVSYDTQRPYGLFRQYIRASCGVNPGDDPESAREKILQHLLSDEGSLPDQDSKQEMASAVSLLLTVDDRRNESPLEGEAFKREIFEAATKLLHQVSDIHPVVFVTDDLHWADPASIDLLQHLLQLSESLPILFLCAFRPYRKAPAWRIKQVAETEYPHRHLHLEIRPLSTDESQALIDHIIAGEIPDPVRHGILQKAEGNPFFVEEVIRELIESGAIRQETSGLRWQAGENLAEIDVPDSIQALLAARVDRLDQATREILQVASVIGRTFSFQVLKSVCKTPDLETHLNTLERLDLVRESARTPEVEYTFQHELTREAIYGTILHRQRRGYHHLVGETIETLYSERLESESHRLAYHFSEARDLPRALKYSRLAGEAAARLYANEEAIVHYQRALAIALESEAAGKDLIDLYRRLGRILEICGQYDQALEIYAQLESLSAERKDPTLRLAGLLAQATIRATLTKAYDPQKARELSEQGLDLARSLNDPQSEARALWNLLLIESMSRKNIDKARRFGEQALAIARRHGLQEELAFILHDLSRVYMEIGQQDSAWSAQLEAQSLWRKMNNLPMLVDSLGNSGQGYQLMGQFEAAIQACEEGLEISRKIGSKWGEAYCLSTIAPIYFEVGEISRSLAALKNAYPLAVEANFGGPLISSWRLRALIYTSLGAYERGQEMLDKANTLISDDTLVGEEMLMKAYSKITQTMLHLAQNEVAQANEAAGGLINSEAVDEPDLYFGSIIYMILGELHLANGQALAAQEAAETGLEQLRAAGIRIYRPDLLLLRGRASLALGDMQAGREALLEARQAAEAILSRRSLLPVLLELVSFYETQGEAAAVQAARRQAHELIEYLSQRIDDPNLLQSFRNSPPVRSVLESTIGSSPG